MKPLCIFSTQRPNTTGRLDKIQSNALRSWCALGCQVALMGEECTTKYLPQPNENVRIVKDGIERIEGVPLIRSMFEGVQKAVPAELYCYVNGDIMLDISLTEAAKTLSEIPGVFMGVGRRWNITVNEEIQFSKFEDTQTFRKTMREFARAKGRLFTPLGIDYFMFPAGVMWPKMPNFVVGHVRWDNWMIWDMLQRKGLLIDLTFSVDVYHQAHECTYRKSLTESNSKLSGYSHSSALCTHALVDGQVLTKS